MTSKAAAKRVETEAFKARVRSVLDKATTAAVNAAAEYAKTAKRTPEGFIADVCGGGYVVVYKLSYRLRTTLKALEEIQPPSYHGGWALRLNWHRPGGAGQSYTANDLACRAACEILKAELGDEGEFYPKSYID